MTIPPRQSKDMSTPTLDTATRHNINRIPCPHYSDHRRTVTNKQQIHTKSALISTIAGANTNYSKLRHIYKR
jgi:hypothetical protein